MYAVAISIQPWRSGVSHRGLPSAQPIVRTAWGCLSRSRGAVFFELHLTDCKIPKYRTGQITLDDDVPILHVNLGVIDLKAVGRDLDDGMIDPVVVHLSGETGKRQPAVVVLVSVVIVDPAVLCEDQDRLWGEREGDGAAGRAIARIRPNRHLRNGGGSLRQTAGYLRKSGRVLRDSRGQLAQLVVDRLQMSRSKLVRGQGRKRRVDLRVVLIEIGSLYLVAAKPLAELIILCVLTGHTDSPTFL